MDKVAIRRRGSQAPGRVEAGSGLPSATTAVGALSAPAVFASGGSAPLDKSEDVFQNGKDPLQKRARRRSVSHPLAKALSEVAEGNLMGNAYRRTLYQCGQLLEQKEGKVRQYFCGYRWCPVCGSIRTARAYAAYGEEVSSWPDAFLVTLTIPSVGGHKLRASVREMHGTFRNVWRSVEYQGMEVKAIRATEVTYSDLRASRGLPAYHPHMHLLVKGRDVAEAIVAAWLKRHPDARRVAQDIRPANRGAVAELFKYSTKLISDKKDADGSRGVVNPKVLDVIFTALRGLRLWQAVGVRSAVKKDAADDTAELELDSGTTATKRPAESVRWEWVQSVRDWVDFETGEVLSGYEPSERWNNFLGKLEGFTELEE